MEITLSVTVQVDSCEENSYPSDENAVRESVNTMSKDSISQKYLESGCNECPNCGSDFLCPDHMETDGAGAWREVECNNCGTNFREVFSFSFIENYEVKEDVS